MKKLLLLLISIITLTACNTPKKDKKENKTEEHKAESGSYKLDKETVIVNWTGFKFTNKTGVKGQMKSINVINNKEAKTIPEALNNVSFFIPSSSVFSNNEIRDNKLISLFFGVMDETEMIYGKVTEVNKNGGTLSLTLNNDTNILPFTLDIKNRTAYLKANLDLKIWGAEKAVNSLHKACELLHTGTDGVSKTWDIVDLDIVLNF